MKTALVVLVVVCLLSASMFTGAASARTYPARGVPLQETYEPYSADQLDNLLAPIALYPDPLLAQVLLAATFVDQVDEAGRWVRAYGASGVDDQSWDVSVKAVAHYPTVLSMMADQLDWTTAVGQAYVNQSTDVMMSIQRLRAMAYAQGNLGSTPQQEVIVDDGLYEIWPAQEQYIFVPTYDPSVIFFRPAYFGGGFGNFLSFGTGFFIGAWLNHDFDWRGHRIFYHGWEGRGWIARSRPHLRLMNVYVNNRYRDITVNRGIISRSVNYPSINRYRGVHGNVTFDNRVRRPITSPNNRVNNPIINRNIDTNDPNLNRHRGRETPPTTTPSVRTPAVRTSPVTPVRPTTRPPNRREPKIIAPPQPAAPGGLRRGDGNFDPRTSSQRGQDSRREMNKSPIRSTTAPSRPAPIRSAPSRPAPSAPRQPTRPSGRRP
jgi:hypothetical protein